LLAAAAAAWLAAALPTSLLADEARVYVREVRDLATYERYSRILGSDRFGKFVIDLKTQDIYFIDVNLFRLHADFVLGYLLKKPWTAENIREYNKNYDRDKPAFILGYLTHHLKVDRYTFAFWEGDEIDAAQIAWVAKRLKTTFFRKDIAYRPDSPAQEKVAAGMKSRGVPVLTNDQIYKQATFQAFNTGRAVGTLRVVARGTAYESLLFERTDIVILQESYPDISPVSGIVSTAFSTPLSHVNLRAKAWGIPNAGFVDAFETYGALDGKIVVLTVRDADHELRAATADEIEAWRTEQKRARTVGLPPADLTRANLAMLTHIRAADVVAYGAKTANLGEIVSARLPEVAVPAGFGVPFFYYVRHLRQHGIDRRIHALLADPRWATDAAFRKQALEGLRATIREAPLDPRVLDAIYKRVRLKLGGVGVFVRSSTNAEDLPGFNGAGLYDTLPNVRGKHDLGEAIKEVWASVWNFRAVEERALFGIDHEAVYAGVLIQVGVNATAAGVLITANLFDPQDPNSFTINAKAGLGMRVVSGTRIPEQIIFDTSNDGTKILSRSDDPVMLVFDDKGGIREVPNDPTGVILSEERAKRLAEAVLAFLPLFPPGQPVDVEWLLEGEKVWIVQSRPFVQK
jgi:hypothetical protein